MDQFTPMLTLIHAAEHIQTSTSSFTNLTPENLGRQQAAAMLYRQSRLLRPPLAVWKANDLDATT